MHKIIFVLIFLALPLHAQVPTPTPPVPGAPGAQKVETPTVWDKAKEYSEKAVELGGKALETSADALKKANAKINESQTNRASTTHSILFNYGVYDLWIPGKMGLTFDYSPSVEKSWEIEYLRGSFGFDIFSVDIGKVTDQRLSLLKRSFQQRNSLNFIYGVEYTNVEAHLGDDLLDSTSNPSQYDVMEISTLGVTWGIGNRWQFSNQLTVGVDWFTINVPLVVLESDVPYLKSDASTEDKKDARNAVDFIEHFPTMSFLKCQIGYSF